MRKFITENRRKNLIDSIQEYFDSDPDISEWSHGFLEDIQIKLQQGKDLTKKQYEKLIEYIEQ